MIPSKDLEKQVRTKKADYITQKQRADEINYQLLPKSIAEEFKVRGPKLPILNWAITVYDRPWRTVTVRDRVFV